ncbi:MAG TPA: hypothetical protein VEA69_25195 [Tepidisphaeraceae bacterium]|nr:hypothetical protein [Tepidisphaeraceae bacterium]
MAESRQLEHCGVPLTYQHKTSGVSGGTMVVYSAVYECERCGVRLAVPERWVEVKASNGVKR